MKKDNYKYYLSGLKGLACIFIMLGHFLTLYRKAQEFPSIRLLDLILNSKFAFLLNEQYWLYLFFIVSGYLVAKSDITRISDLFRKSVTRFFRLGIPILFSYLLIYIVYRTIGFHNMETKDLFTCNWYQGFYPGVYSIKDVILGPVEVLINGKSTLNSPYWVLRLMFISSILIYILKFYYRSMSCSPKKHDAFLFFSLMIVTFASYIISPIITACLMGMLISFYEDRDITEESYFSFWVLVIAMGLYVFPTVIISCIFFGALIICVPKIRWLNSLFSSKPFQFLGKISWGVYSFHWPITCSIGAITILKLSGTMGLTGAYLSSFVIIFSTTVFAALVYYLTFEKLSSFLTAKINLKLYNLLDSSNR